MQATPVMAAQPPATSLSGLGATDRLPSSGHPSHRQIGEGLSQSFQQHQRVDASIPFREQSPMGDAWPDGLQLVPLKQGESAG